MSSVSVSAEEVDSGHQSGEPQSRRMRTSSTWRRYARGVVRDERADPDSGVNVIISSQNNEQRDKSGLLVGANDELRQSSGCCLSPIV